FMVQNYGEVRGQMAANPALWSLPVEMELYAVYLLFLLLWWRYGTGITFGTVAIVSFAALGLYFYGHDWTVANFAKYWIIWCAGAWLAERARRGTLPAWRPWCWFAPIAIAMVGIWGKMKADLIPDAAAHFIWGAVYFFVLWGALSGTDVQARLGALTQKVFDWLGDISYSLYLVHYPFFTLCGAAWVHRFGSKPANLLIAFAFV